MTVDDVMDLNPCLEYPRSRVLELIGEGGTPLELFDLVRGEIPGDDVLWFGISCLEPRDRRLFAAACAERVLPLFERKFPEDLRPREAIKSARLFALGEIGHEELKNPWDAGVAVGDIWCYAKASMWSISMDSWNAAWDTARAAWEISGGVWYNAGAAETNLQLEDLRRYLEAA